MKKLFAGMMLLSVLLAGCAKSADTDLTSETKPEKERFIAATTEITCPLLQSKDLLDPALKEMSKEVFRKYGFNVDDEKAFDEIAKGYQSDKDLQEAVKKALEECKGDLFNGAAADNVPTESK